MLKFFPLVDLHSNVRNHTVTNTLQSTFALIHKISSVQMYSTSLNVCVCIVSSSSFKLINLLMNQVHSSFNALKHQEYQVLRLLNYLVIESNEKIKFDKKKDDTRSLCCYGVIVRRNKFSRFSLQYTNIFIPIVSHHSHCQQNTV